MMSSHSRDNFDCNAKAKKREQANAVNSFVRMRMFEVSNARASYTSPHCVFVSSKIRHRLGYNGPIAQFGMWFWWLATQFTYSVRMRAVLRFIDYEQFMLCIGTQAMFPHKSILISVYGCVQSFVLQLILKDWNAVFLRILELKI